MVYQRIENGTIVQNATRQLYSATERNETQRVKSCEEIILSTKAIVLAKVVLQ